MDRRTRRWHDQLSQIVLHLENSEFSWAGITQPIENIRQYTDKYLSHEENLSPRDQDDHLKGLIAEHSDQMRAVLACSHALSHLALREQILTIKVNTQREEEILNFLQIILTAHEINTTAISATEVKWVNCFKELMSANQNGAQAAFQSYDQLVIEEAIPTLLKPSILHGILKIAIKRLGLRLEHWKEAGEWTKAYQNSRWMRKVSSSLSHLKCILDSNIRHWESWALWEPNILHLRALDELKTSQRKELQDIFTLEGPDFKSSPPKRNLAAVVASSIQGGAADTQVGTCRLRWRHGLTGLVDSLLKKIVKACKVSEQVGAITSYIVRNNVIDEVTLGVLDVIETIDPSIISAIFEAISTDTREIRFSAVVNIIPELANSQIDLQRSLSPLIRLTLNESVSVLQDKFNENLRQGHSLKNVGKKLHRIGSLIRQNPWLQHLIDPHVWSVMSNYPPRDNIETLFELREEAANDRTATGITFRSLVDTYCISVFTGQVELDLHGRVMIEHLFEFWQKEFTLDRRRLAINIAQRNSIPSKLRCDLFEDIHRMSEDFCEIALAALFHTKQQGCVDFARALASYRKIGRQEKYHWQSVLKSMIDAQSSTLLNYTATNLPIHQWFKWLRDLRSLFLHSNRDPSVVLNSAICDWAALCNWGARLEDTEMEALISLEKIIGTDRLRRIFLVPKDEELVILFLDMVKEINQEECCLKPIYDQILAQLAPDWSNLPQLGDIISHLCGATDNGKTLCLRLVENWKSLPLKTCKGIFQVWISQRQHFVNAPPEVTPDDLLVIQQVGLLLGLDITPEDNLNDCLAAACEHLNKQFEELVAEATRLKAIRRTLMAQNRDETMEFLAGLGVTDLDDGIVDIPEALADVIEQHGFQEFEIIFPLDNLKPLQRIAMGVEVARNIMVRLNLVDDFESKPQFCVHMNPEQTVSPGSRSANRRAWVGEHYYWIAHKGSRAPDLNFCTGRGNRTTYLVSMVLWRHFSKQGFESLESVHKIVSSVIKDYGQNCLICGSQLKAKVFRATVCHQSSCNTQFSRADYEVRLADLRWDPSVMDLLLLGIFASAQANRLEFLHPCPLRDQGTILQTMAGLPDIYTLQNSPDLYKSIKCLGQDAEALMLWMASYRGFVASATGLLKIPNLPGVHQFILANTTPELETSYNFHLPTPQTPTQVVFHGTTMDRLFPILQRGLQVGTGTALLQNGASYGSGIYVATDISMSFTYASVVHGYGWPNTRLGNTKVIFACELAGSQYQNGGVYVVPDPTHLRIRYIFLFPSTAYPPVAHHIVPAIQSAFSLLRLGQV